MRPEWALWSLKGYTLQHIIDVFYCNINQIFKGVDVQEKWHSRNGEELVLGILWEVGKTRLGLLL